MTAVHQPSPSSSHRPRGSRGRTRLFRAPEQKGAGSEQTPQSPETGKPTGHTPSAPGKPGHRGAGKKRSFSDRRGGGRGGFERRQPFRAAPQRNLPQEELNKEYDPPVPDKDTVRIIPLGGVEEVGRNMLAIETAEGIIISDVGFQFVSEDGTPGVDYILPNTRYLERHKDRIRGVFITHAHLDHIGGIPFIMDRIGNPPIFTQYVTSLMIKKRQEEFQHLPALSITELEPGASVMAGPIRVKTFPVTHSIPDSMGIAIETPHGAVVITGDLKLDHDDGTPTPREEKVWSEVGAGKNLMFIGDSTNAERDGFSITERRVHDTLEEIIRSVKGRLIIGTFASQFERMIKIIQVAESMGKKIVTEGRSIRSNIEIAEKAGLLKIKKDTVIRSEDIGNYPSDRIIILATGAQGEEFAALMRIATKKHKTITLNERDTIVFSSSVIPGNEIAVQKLKDNLYRHNITLIHYRSSDVHSTGHGNTGELVWINKKVGARFFMPGYGYYSMTRCHANAVIKSGFPKENIVLGENGMVIDIVKGEKLHIHKQKVPANPMMVDGFSIGHIQEVVIRDRQTLAQDGMFVIIATVDGKTGKLRKSPDIISRGFVYLRESQELLQQARIIVKKAVEQTSSGMQPVNFDYVKTNVTDAVERFLFQKTNKRPIVIPVILGV